MFVPHRLWECMRLPDEDVYGEIMQQADASALRLFEALVVTLPETLLQTYVLICTDIGVRSPENALLLMASSWLFAMVSWDTVGIPAAVFCSFLIGLIALVLYYRFLHPKSFEIFQSIRHRGIGGACMEHGSTLSLEEKVEPSFHHHTTLSGW
ncbi:hypothetical protein GOODEAATRI_028299 [Goodea atripinnis]|uniref:XK-related protein n=1 Tax=Goodea atripinnis TaxID=208336 RepID=A0ABV0MLH1_9TELE